tara:strand:+ start:248 stop:550 length:303 start_codon:yes stop_codon:yes gene_type:complete
MVYKQIFKEKQEFGLFHNQMADYYTFRENQDKGEFVNREGNVVAQLYEANTKNSYFIIAGMFMGDLITIPIPYQRTFRIKNGIMHRPHTINTKKIIQNNE